MGDPAGPDGPTVPGPIPRDPPPPPGYVDPLDRSPVLDELSEEARVDEDVPRALEKS